MSLDGQIAFCKYCVCSLIIQGASMSNLDQTYHFYKVQLGEMDGTLASVIKTQFHVQALY